MRWLVHHLMGTQFADEATRDDERAIAGLRTAGINLDCARVMVHESSFSTDAEAEFAAELLGRFGRTAEVQADLDRATWMVTVRHEQVITPQAVGRLRAEFEAVVGGLGGSYHGWSSPAEARAELATGRNR